ncbi:hypothetical protein OROGR_017135 [Orobanche gracilis]
MPVLVAIEDDMGDGELIPEGTTLDGENDGANQNCIELSHLAAGGFRQTLNNKVCGPHLSFGSRVIINSGARHYFISEAVAHQLNISVDRSVQPMVYLLDGRRGRIVGKCRAVPFFLGDVCFDIDCFGFPFCGIDAILVVSSLETLGEVWAIWARMTIGFPYNGTSVYLRAHPSLSRKEISAASLYKLRDVEESWVLWMAPVLLLNGGRTTEVGSPVIIIRDE